MALLLDLNINGTYATKIADKLRTRGIPFIFVTGDGSSSWPSLPRRFLLAQTIFTDRPQNGAHRAPREIVSAIASYVHVRFGSKADICSAQVMSALCQKQTF